VPSAAVTVPVVQHAVIAAEARASLDPGLVRGKGGRNRGCLSGKQAGVCSSLLLCSIFVYKLFFFFPSFVLLFSPLPRTNKPAVLGLPLKALRTLGLGAQTASHGLLQYKDLFISLQGGLLKKKKSQNRRIVGVGRDLCGSSSPTPLPKQGHLQ